MPPDPTKGGPYEVRVLRGNTKYERVVDLHGVLMVVAQSLGHFAGSPTPGSKYFGLRAVPQGTLIKFKDHTGKVATRALQQPAVLGDLGLFANTAGRRADFALLLEPRSYEQARKFVQDFVAKHAVMQQPVDTGTVMAFYNAAVYDPDFKRPALARKG